MLFLVVLTLVVGCVTKEAKLVGVWKAEPVKAVSSPNLGDVVKSSMLGLVTQNLEIEFNRTELSSLEQASRPEQGSTPGKATLSC